MRHRVTGTQNVSRMCMVCGRDNTAGLAARFLELDNGELLGVFQPREEHQGYPGRLHGGVASMLLDETIGRAVSVGNPDSWGVTVELTVRYRRPVPLDGEVLGRRAHHARQQQAFRGHRRDRAPGRHRRGGGVRASTCACPSTRSWKSGWQPRWFADEGSVPAEVELPD